MQDVET